MPADALDLEDRATFAKLMKAWGPSRGRRALQFFGSPLYCRPEKPRSGVASFRSRVVLRVSSFVQCSWNLSFMLFMPRPPPHIVNPQSGFQGSGAREAFGFLLQILTARKP